MTNISSVAVIGGGIAGAATAIALTKAGIEATRPGADRGDTRLRPDDPMHSMPSVPRRHTDRCVLVGDAAHAPSPTSGQGASLAIEDAVVLAQTLRDSAGPGEAWAAFETVRRPRVEKIVRAAARVNNSKAPSGFGRAMRDVLLPVILRLTANSRADQETYGHHLEWTAGAATGGSGR